MLDLHIFFFFPGATMSQEVEKYRHVHESPTEWRLRKLFLDTHKDKFDEERLLCLAR